MQLAVILPSIIILFLRWYLMRENKRRDALAAANTVLNTGIIESVEADGTKIAHVVDNNQLDLTDRENLTLYVIHHLL